MPTKKSTNDKKDPSGEAVEKFQKLAALALSEEDEESTEEARTAAVKAIEMLADDHSELTVVPRAYLAELQSAVNGSGGALAVSKAKRDGMLLGAVGGFLFAKGGLGR